jgi:hypothetical protein
LRLRGGGPDRVLPSPLCGRLSLQCLFFRALRLASRLAKLVLRLSELVLEALQVGLEVTDLTLDRVDPVYGSSLRVGCGGNQRGAERCQRAIAAVGFCLTRPPLMMKVANFVAMQRDNFLTLAATSALAR